MIHLLLFPSHSFHKQPTDIPGLPEAWYFTDFKLNSRDMVKGVEHKKPSQHFGLIEQLSLMVFAVGAKNVMEIGVHRPRLDGDMSSTKVILNQRPVKYLGVDIKNRRNEIEWLTYQGTKSSFYHGSSNDFEAVHQALVDWDVLPLDLLMVDGNHSVNQAYADFRYADLVRPGGYVVYHDTNWHPGPVLLFDSVDTIMYDRERYGVDSDSYGLGVFIKRG